MGQLRALSRIGDTKLSWDNNEEEIKNAREIFNKRVRDDKWSAFREKRIGGKGERIYVFDPNAARIILVPPIEGG